ncbi:MAG: hypothetical protein ACRCU2_00835 [Planktothrix sp.]
MKISNPRLSNFIKSKKNSILESIDMKKVKFFSSITITVLSLIMLIYTLIKLAHFDKGETFVQIESGISDVIVEQSKPLVNPENALSLVVVFLLIAILGIFFSVKVSTTDENNINFTTTPEGSDHNSES